MSRPPESLPPHHGLCLCVVPPSDCLLHVSPRPAPPRTRHAAMFRQSAGGRDAQALAEGDANVSVIWLCESYPNVWLRNSKGGTQQSPQGNKQWTVTLKMVELADFLKTATLNFNCLHFNVLNCLNKRCQHQLRTLLKQLQSFLHNDLFI